MKVLIMNVVNGIGSTGKICEDILRQYSDLGYEVKIVYGRGKDCDFGSPISNSLTGKLSFYSHVFITRIFDKHGLGSKFITKLIIKDMDNYKPDILWLHNIHGYYINYEMLFKWIKKQSGIEVKWTLHDCWSFTGHCSYFSHEGCEKWKTGCFACPLKTSYPKSVLFSNARGNYKRKKSSFCGVNNMKLIVPSVWLKKIVKESFLKDYPVEVILNEVDRNIFYKRKNANLKQKLNIENKIILLGVANVWSKNKGLGTFLELSKIISNKYQIVLVGLSDKQRKKIPKNVICLNRTDNLDELAEIYSSSDIYLNLSTEETFGMTTLEAIFCGCKTIIIKGTAGEEIVNKYGHIAVNNNINDIYNAITDSI